MVNSDLPNEDVDVGGDAGDGKDLGDRGDSKQGQHAVVKDEIGVFPVVGTKGGNSSPVVVETYGAPVLAEDELGEGEA